MAISVLFDNVSVWFSAQCGQEVVLSTGTEPVGLCCSSDCSWYTAGGTQDWGTAKVRKAYCLNGILGSGVSSMCRKLESEEELHLGPVESLSAPPCWVLHAWMWL